jgi:hypothetical protein
MRSNQRPQPHFLPLKVTLPCVIPRIRRATLLCPYAPRLGSKASDRHRREKERDGEDVRVRRKGIGQIVCAHVMEIMETQMRKKKDELSCLGCTFGGFLCFILNYPLPLPKLLSSTPTAGCEHSYLHPGECGFRVGSIYGVCIYSMHVYVSGYTSRPGQARLSRLIIARSSAAGNSLSLIARRYLIFPSITL